MQGERNQVYLNCRAAAYLLQSYVKKLINLLSLLYSLFLLRHFLPSEHLVSPVRRGHLLCRRGNYLRDIFSFLRDIFPYMRRNFFLLAQKVFVTNFVINFSRMIGKICLLMAKTLRQGVKIIPVIVMVCSEENALCH